MQLQHYRLQQPHFRLRRSLKASRAKSRLLDIAAGIVATTAIVITVTATTGIAIGATVTLMVAFTGVRKFISVRVGTAIATGTTVGTAGNQ